MSHFAAAIAFALTMVAVSLLPLALGNIVLGLISGTVCRRFVRGRHLLWMLPVGHVLLFLALEPRVDLVLMWKGPLPGWMRALAIATVFCGAMLAAVIVAVVRRLAFPAGHAVAGHDSVSSRSVLRLPTAGPIHPPRGFLGAMREGVAAPVDGFVFMLDYPSLWRYAIAPVLLNILISLFVLILLICAGTAFAVALHPRFPQVWWGLVLEVFTGAALLLVAGALAVGVGIALNGVLCRQFHSKLARHAELILGMTPDQMHEAPLRRQVVDSLHDLGWLLAVNLGLLALNIVPVAGTITAVPLACYLNGMELGIGYLEMPMSLRALRRTEQRAVARRHRWQTIGLGLAVFVLNLVPVIGSVLLASASVGAVLLYRRLEIATTNGIPGTSASDTLAGAHSGHC